MAEKIFRRELEELRGKDLVTRAQIEAEISRLEAIPAELAAHQHRRLVQSLPGFVLPADIYLALIPPPRPPVYPVIGDLFYRPGMSLIDGRGVLGPSWRKSGGKAPISVA